MYEQLIYCLRNKIIIMIAPENYNMEIRRFFHFPISVDTLIIYSKTTQ